MENPNVQVKKLWSTPDAEKLVLYMARVSSDNRDSEDTKLLGYLIRNKHFSPFEMVNLCVEITCSRSIARQILRHRSFSFQEYSLRYAALKEDSLITNNARQQDKKNRQKSTDNTPDNIKQEWLEKQKELNQKIYESYTWALQNGIAKECARVVLPEGNMLTTICMNGSLRSWIHYCELRCANGTQLEHELVAKECLKIFKEEFPIIYKAVFENLKR